jgi:hypothetical protein
MILSTVTKFLPKEEIIFIVSNFNDTTSNSSDIDIYCITTGKSFIECFYDENHQWVELFVDNIFDVNKKIENMDEIAINFIRELNFCFGSKEIYSDFALKASLATENYALPPQRKDIIKYRVKVLLSKLLNPVSESLVQHNFIINSLSYPLIQLIFESNKIFPSSPKRWIQQLHEVLPESDFETLERFINQQINDKEITDLCEKYAGNLNSISLMKESNNNLTFLS